jgi:hypothetical protein
MKRLIFGFGSVIIMLSLMGCGGYLHISVSPDWYGPPYYTGPYYGYYYYGGYGYRNYYGYPYWGWGPRWVPGYIRQVCEDRPMGRVCYETWVPGHYE